MTTRDRKHGLLAPLNAEAVEQGRAKGWRNTPMAARVKGGAASKGVRRPRISAAEKALLPQGRGLWPAGGGGNETQRAVQGGGQGGGMRILPLT